MSIIKEFKAIRPVKELAAKVAAKPYDVLSSEEARAEVKDNKYSFLRIDKAEIDLPKDTHLYDKKVYQKAKENFISFQKEGIFFQEAKPCLYIYAQTMNNRTQYGIAGCASIEEYENDIIKKHEFTRKDKEEDRINHVKVLNANTGPIFLTYKDHQGINSFVEQKINLEPEYDFICNEQVRHRLWIIDNKEEIILIKNYFNEIPNLYVADGHHRSASAYKVGQYRKEHNLKHTGQEEYNFFLAVYFPASQLMIMDYNRLVKDLNSLNEDEFFSKLSEKFEITESDNSKPLSAKNIKMYIDKKWYNLTAKVGTYPSNDPVNSLDVAILQNNILSPILNISDPRTDKRIDFVGGIRGVKELEEKVASKEFKLAFLMCPTNIGELMSVADAGLTMPPKSTWFEPKLKSGLLIHDLE